jgi:hypothetical protein
MFTDILRLWSVIPAIAAALWHSGFDSQMYGWDLGKKIFILHYTSAIQERKYRPSL